MLGMFIVESVGRAYDDDVLFVIARWESDNECAMSGQVSSRVLPICVVVYCVYCLCMSVVALHFFDRPRRCRRRDRSRHRCRNQNRSVAVCVSHVNAHCLVRVQTTRYM